MKKKTTVASKSGNMVAVLNPEFVFRSLPSLFLEDGSMRKNAKSELAVMLESLTSPLKELPIIPINTVIINDGMASIQGINVSYLIFFKSMSKSSLDRS